MGRGELEAENQRLAEQVDELTTEFEPDLSECPYFVRDGREGAYGPNTCGFGCSDEPECQTCRPSEGWPSESHPLLIRESQTVTDLAAVVFARDAEIERLRAINSELVTTHNLLLVEVCRAREAVDAMVRRDLAELEAGR